MFQSSSCLGTLQDHTGDGDDGLLGLEGLVGFWIDNLCRELNLLSSTYQKMEVVGGETAEQ